MTYGSNRYNYVFLACMIHRLQPKLNSEADMFSARVCVCVAAVSVIVKPWDSLPGNGLDVTEKKRL